MMNTTLLLITLLFTKHFIVDFPLQPSFMYSNKGTYGHPGGLAHAGLHGVFTWYCLMWIDPFVAMWAALGDAFVHYHIDWAKMNINNKMGWGPTTHDQFWWLMGLDQFLHALTYIGIIAWVMK